MKLRSSPILGLVCMVTVLAMDTQVDCKDIASSGLLDAMWFSAAVAVAGENTQTAIAANNEEQAGQSQPGAPGAAGINCWDLNGDGVDDADEDVNDDGVWDALDCQGTDGATGASGTDGTDGVDGTDGTDGANGTNGTDGQDGADLTGTLARGWIPGADHDQFPFDLGAVFVPAAGKAVNIISAVRPEPEAGNPSYPTPGEYIVQVALPERDTVYTRDEIVVMISVEARRLDQDPGPLYQLFGYWQIMPEVLDGNNIVGNVLKLKIMIKAGSAMIPADGNFSLVVMAP